MTEQNAHAHERAPLVAVWSSQRMDRSDVIAELVEREKRFPPGVIQADTEPLLSEEDLHGWALSTGLSTQRTGWRHSR